MNQLQFREIHLDPSADSDRRTQCDELVKYYLSVCSLKMPDQQWQLQSSKHYYSILVKLLQSKL